MWIVGGLVVFAIAAAAVGVVTARLAGDEDRAVYDVDQSIDFVAEALPGELTAQLSFDDVRLMLRLYHDFLHAKGLATTAGEPDPARGPLVIATDEAVAYVVRRAELAEIELDPDHVEAVIDAQLEYFAAIGVIGAPVDGPVDDLDEIDDRPDGSSGGNDHPSDGRVG